MASYVISFNLAFPFKMTKADILHNPLIQTNIRKKVRKLEQLVSNRYLVGATTLSITTFCITTLSITTFCITTLSIMTFSITTLSILTLSIITFSIKGLYETLSISDTNHNDIQPNNTQNKGLTCDTQHK